MSSFSEEIYRLLKQVPMGRVTTYKSLAQALGTKAYRAVGQAVKKNPYAPFVPCHRVVLSSGEIGGFKGRRAGGAIDEKRKMLEKEGIKFVGNRVKDFEKHFFRSGMGKTTAGDCRND